MNKGLKILIVIIVIIIVIIAAGAAVLLSSPYGSIVTSAVASKTAPAVEPTGTGCGEDIECVTQLAEDCEVGNSQFNEDGTKGLLQIFGKEERGCKAYIRIDESPMIPAELAILGIKPDMTCYFTKEELDALQASGYDPSSLDVESVDCSGTLYEAIKSMQ